MDKSENIPFSPDITDEEINAVVEVLSQVDNIRQI